MRVARSAHHQGDNAGRNRKQKTVQGKKQHGPDDMIGHEAGGNEGGKGQNIHMRADIDERPHKHSRDLADERGPHGGSGGGQGNRQNRAVNRAAKMGGWR